MFSCLAEKLAEIQTFFTLRTYQIQQLGFNALFSLTCSAHELWMSGPSGAVHGRVLFGVDCIQSSVVLETAVEALRVPP